MSTQYWVLHGLAHFRMLHASLLVILNYRACKWIVSGREKFISNGKIVHFNTALDDAPCSIT